MDTKLNILASYEITKIRNTDITERSRWHPTISNSANAKINKAPTFQQPKLTTACINKVI
jgi:hypothetical protein